MEPMMGSRTHDAVRLRRVVLSSKLAGLEMRHAPVAGRDGRSTSFLLSSIPPHLFISPSSLPPQLFPTLPLFPAQWPEVNSPGQYFSSHYSFLLRLMRSIQLQMDCRSGCRSHPGFQAGETGRTPVGERLEAGHLPECPRAPRGRWYHPDGQSDQE